MSLSKLSEKMKCVSETPVDKTTTETEKKGVNEAQPGEESRETENPAAGSEPLTRGFAKKQAQKPPLSVEISGNWEKSDEPGALAERNVRPARTSMNPRPQMMNRAIIERLTEDDVDEVVQVLRDALKATSTFWDQKAKAWVQVPDHRTRLTAATTIIAHKDGLPIQRQIVLTNGFIPLDEQMRAVVTSPEAQRELARLGFVSQSSQNPPQGEEPEKA